MKTQYFIRYSVEMGLLQLANSLRLLVSPFGYCTPNNIVPLAYCFFGWMQKAKMILSSFFFSDIQGGESITADFD